MIQELQSVSHLRAQSGAGFAYIGRLGSLPGTSSLASSWALHTKTVSHFVLKFVAARRGAKKSRLGGAACLSRAAERLHTHDCGFSWQRAVNFRALSW